MIDMTGFGLFYDDNIEHIKLHDNKLYNFRYFTNTSEGGSSNPIYLGDFDYLIQFFLKEIKERDAILDKLKTTRETTIGITHGSN